MVAGLEFRALPLEFLLVSLGRPQRLAARQQEVARVAVFDPDGLAHMAKLAYAFQQDDIHVRLLFVRRGFWGRKKCSAGAKTGEGVDEAERREDRKRVFGP